MTSIPTKEEIQIAAQVALIERLRVSEQRYSDLVNSLSAVIFSADKQGNITYLNNAWEALVGFSQKETVGKNLSDFFISEENKNLALEQMLPTSLCLTKEFKCKIYDINNEVLWFNVSAKLDLANNSISGTMHDVSREVMLEKERRSLEKARNNFFSGMSHELRTPINGTILASELIVQSTDGDTAKYANAIKKSAKHLLEIVDEILDYSKAEAAQLKLHNTSFNLVKEISSTADIFRPVCAENNVELKVDIDSGVPKYIITDLKRLKQILNNLLSNASKFTRQGNVCLNLSSKFTENSCQVYFSVKDTGIGISESKLKDLFTPFKQADESIQSEFGGTGLGLSLAKELVELMGGEIKVESEEGVGTCFSFFINCALPKEHEYSPKEKSNKNVELNSFKNSDKVLIVEDDKVTSMVLSAMLVKQHACNPENIVVAETGSEFRSKLNDDPIDLVFMDCNLPDCDGADLVTEIRNHINRIGHPLPYIVFSTASTGTREAELIEKSHPNANAIKPITTEKLASIMKNYYSYSR